MPGPARRLHGQRLDQARIGIQLGFGDPLLGDGMILGDQLGQPVLNEIPIKDHLGHDEIQPRLLRSDLTSCYRQRHHDRQKM